MRLIDADALIQKRNHAKNYSPDMYVIGQGYVMDAPTIDAVPVVRCGECLSAKWYESGDFYCQKWGERYDSPYTLTGQSKTDFCSHGSKKECKEIGGNVFI